MRQLNFIGQADLLATVTEIEGKMDEFGLCFGDIPPLVADRYAACCRSLAADLTSGYPLVYIPPVP